MILDARCPYCGGHIGFFDTMIEPRKKSFYRCMCTDCKSVFVAEITFISEITPRNKMAKELGM